jgi:hypothetical protein
MCQFVRGDVVAVASVEPRNRCLELLYRCGPVGGYPGRAAWRENAPPEQRHCSLDDRQVAARDNPNYNC